MAVEREAVHCWSLPNFAVEQTAARIRSLAAAQRRRST
jgi:hypothetical protein